VPQGGTLSRRTRAHSVGTSKSAAGPIDGATKAEPIHNEPRNAHDLSEVVGEPFESFR
jgi:hypothetical protein